MAIISKTDSRISAEKEFYLQHFRQRSIVLHLARDEMLADVRPVLDELLANRTLVVVSLSLAASGCDPIAVHERGPATPSGLIELSARLLHDGIACAGAPPAAAVSRRLELSCRLAIRLGAHKLVVVDPRGGLRRGAAVRSFVKASSLRPSSRDGCGRGRWRAAELARIRDAVAAGVESVNLATAADLAAELFTYEGAGTLVTAGEYAHVERLGVDDFPEALALLERGEREGFLLPRTPSERAAVLLAGYGVRLEGRRLAGIAGLRTDAYRRQRLAEVVGLYTITRFQGEGVGVRLVDALCDASREHRARAIFASTSNERAAGFFLRNGFAAVGSDQVPAVKWKGRSSPRPDRVYWRDL